MKAQGERSEPWVMMANMAFFVIRPRLEANDEKQTNAII